MDSKKQIFSRLQCSKNLPSLPQILIKLIEICDKDDVHYSEISQLILKDVSISSRVLCLINSAYYGVNGTVSNIDQAVMCLGAETIKNIALTASVQQVFTKLKKNRHFSMSQFWLNSFSSAIYAQKIAEQISYANIEEAYLAGLLHDLGELLLWVNFANECSMVPTLIEDKGIHQCVAEEEQIGINHCEAGAWLTRQWTLDPLIGDAVLHHHSPLEQIKGAFPLVKLVYFSEQCCQVIDNDFDTIYDLGEELFGLTVKDINTIKESVANETKEVAESLGVDVTPPSERTKEQVEILAEQAIDLFHQVRDYSFLHGFMEDLVQAENRDEIFIAIEKALNMLFDIDTIFFFLHDFEEQKLFGNASTLNPYTGQLQSLVISAEQGTSLLVKSMLEGEFITSLPDADSPLENLADSQLLDLICGKGMLYVPMVNKKVPVGVLVVGLPGTLKIDLSNPVEFKLLQLFASQAASSLYLDVLTKKQDEKVQDARLYAASMGAAKVVHGIHSPLAIIRNYLKILELKVSEDESSTNALTIIDGEIDRIATITQQLDSFSNPVKNKFELTDINTLLSDLFSIFSKSVFYSSQLQIHFTPDPELPAILTDESSIKQIMINLIKNAAEAMTDGGNVYIKTSSAHSDETGTGLNAPDHYDSVKIALLDDGPGMPDEVFSHLFEPFISTKGKGHSGLGLSVVNSLATELKGTVKCVNRKGKGTLFTIVLPVR
jgi:HD-like signal output (HDOD) protein/signal transduction histidine kinase